MTTAQRLRLLVFLAVALAAILFAGVEYVGIPQRYLGQSYVVSADLPSSGGIFTNAEVTLNGVEVGRVGKLTLTPDGVRVQLRIDKGVHVPHDTLVQVADLSAVGEQYVNLLPQTDAGPYLRGGDNLSKDKATVPLQVQAVLLHLDALATSIGKPELQTLVTELGTAFDHGAGDLQTILDQAQVLTAKLAAAQPATNTLLRDAGTDLATQHDLAAQLRVLATGLDQLSATFRAQDPQLRQLLDQGPAAVDQLTEVLRDNQANVSVLLGNLLTVTQIVAAPVRLSGVNIQLVLLPRIVQGTFNIQPGDGYARLGAVVDTSMGVCTKGYESSGQAPTQAEDLSAVPGNPSFRSNLDAYCALPATSGVDVRGAANAVRPPGDTTATPPAHTPNPDPAGSSTTSGTSAAPAATAVPTYSIVGGTDLRGLLLGPLLESSS